MASIGSFFKTANNIVSICGRILIQPKSCILKQMNYISPTTLNPTSIKQFHTTISRFDLMEFFDNKNNWGQNEVKCGRSWKTDELRIKSNTDLHKLWYVLLKEKNMLLTMEYECNQKMEIFPNPERIDKVNLSMENIETVVRERNQAYYLLETGETGERPKNLIWNSLGMKYLHKQCEHLIPKWANKKWHATHQHGFRGAAVNKFRLLYREKVYNERRRARNRNRNHVQRLLQRFPNIDKNLIREKYPDVNLDKLLWDDKCRGNFSPK